LVLAVVYLIFLRGDNEAPALHRLPERLAAVALIFALARETRNARAIS